MDLKTLCEINAPAGNEGDIRKAIVERAKEFCDDVKIDRMGNVICHKKGTNPDASHVTIAAHMDEVGFIIRGYTEDGMLKFSSIGGIDPRVIVSKWVLVNGETKGVIGAKAIHLQSKADREKLLDYDSLYIDIGAKDKAEAEKLAPLASYVSFISSYEEIGDGFILAKALDDRVGCYNMLRLLEGSYPCDVSFAFTVQEEVGLRGSMGAAFGIDADIAIILEGTACNDLGDVKERFHVCTLGEGVAVSFMDLSTIADKELFHAMLSIASENNIKAQVKRSVTGGNDAAAFQRAKEGCRTVVLSVPCRYIHSPSSMCKKSDVDAQYELSSAFLKQYK